MSNESITPVENEKTQAHDTAKKSDNNELSRQKSLKTFNKKKRKKIIKTLIILLLLIAGLVFAAYKTGYLDKLLGIEDETANTITTYSLNEDTAYRTITKVLTSTGTVEPNEEYPITSLVSGEILNDYFNEGDTVIKDQPLYEVESDSLDTAERRASNNLKTAESSLEEAYKELDKLNIISEISGVIQEIYVEAGDEVSKGQIIADVIDSDIMVLEIPFLEEDAINIKPGDAAIVSFVDSPEVVDGKVEDISPVATISAYGSKTRLIEISVKNPGSIIPGSIGLATVGSASYTSHGTFRYNEKGSIYAKTSGDVIAVYFLEGNKLQEGDVIAKLESTSLRNQIETLEINVDNAKSTLKDAQDAYDNYTITSPVTGTVISKDYKKGDTIGGNSGNAQLAVIYDMSALKFKMNIDELDIDSLEEGQEVIITSDSRAGYNYYGSITNISILGTTSNGTTVYPVEVTIENVEDESQRTVSEDGTINRVYKTGMTSAENTYSIIETVTQDDGSIIYRYGNDTEIKRINNQSGYLLYIGDKKLNPYTNTSYIYASTIYTFGDDFSEITIEVRNEKKMLRPGMNIDAEIIVEKRENVIAIPVTAVGRGNVVKTLKNPADAKTNGNSGNRYASQENAYGTASADSEVEEVRVTVGISDNEYVQITGGVEIGDVIVIESAERTISDSKMFGMMGMGGMGGMPVGMGGNMGGNRTMGGMPGGMGGNISGNRSMGGNMPK